MVLSTLDPARTTTPSRAAITSATVAQTVWFTGLPSSGKSTLAHAVGARLMETGHRVEVLDGDVLRQQLCADLGFSQQDRRQNVERIGFVAALLAKHGVTVLVAVIAPYAESRASVRRLHQHTGVAYREVYVDAPLAICQQRDVKGLYAKQRSGELVGLTGVDAVYEPPINPDLVIKTQTTSLAVSTTEVLALVGREGHR